MPTLACWNKGEDDDDDDNDDITSIAFSPSGLVVTRLADLRKSRGSIADGVKRSFLTTSSLRFWLGRGFFWRF